MNSLSLASRALAPWLGVVAVSCSLCAFAAVAACSDDLMAPPLGAMGAGSGAPGTAGADAPGATCTGKRGALRGRSMQMLMAGGLNRSFVYYAPSTLDPNQAAPIVIVPHGYTMSADMMFDITNYAAIADREKFIVVFPNGQASGLGAPWNVGNPDCSSTAGALPVATGDDNAFIDAMINFADADQCVDRNHVFMSGFSMGGYLANETGCMRPDIRAIGPHSGGSHDFATCRVTNKPVVVMHFEGDTLIPYTCGTQARDRWIKLNGCLPDAPDVTMVTGGRCEYYKGCPANGQVAMCSFTNPPGTRTEAFAGHGWSGGSKQGPAGGASFAIPETESASELSWAFFKKYAW
jgi:polyhydroxybutyrate depolymerase